MLSIIKRSAVTDHSGIGYKLHKLTFALDRRADSLLQDKLDITLSQFILLLGTAHYPQTSQCTVARFLNLTQAAVSRQIDTLVERKLVSRTENSENRREHVLALTTSGDEVLTLAKAEIETLYKRLLDISNADLKTFTRILDALINEVGAGKDFRKTTSLN